MAQVTIYGFLIYLLSVLMQSLAASSATDDRDVSLLSPRRLSFSQLFPFSGIESLSDLVISPPHARDNAVQESSSKEALSSNSHDIVNNCTDLPLLHYCRNHRIVSSCTKSRNIILFIVNFHNPFYSLVPFFEESYFATFCRYFAYDFDFIFIGPGDGSDGVLGNGLETKGYYSYMSLVRVREYLGISAFSYLGFYLMNDDSCLNPLLLNSFNFSKSFTEGSGRYNPYSKWYWNNATNSEGVPFYQAFIRTVREIAYVRPHYRECLKRENWKCGWSDSFYVTRKDIGQVNYFFNVMFSKRVFLEVAVPTSMNCVGADAIPSCNHNGNRSVLNYHMHPVKFSKEENRELCLHRMNMTSLSYNCFQ